MAIKAYWRTGKWVLDIRSSDPIAVRVLAKQWLPEISRQMIAREPKGLLYYRCGNDLRLVAMVQEAVFKQYGVEIR